MATVMQLSVTILKNIDLCALIVSVVWHRKHISIKLLLNEKEKLEINEKLVWSGYREQNTVRVSLCLDKVLYGNPAWTKIGNAIHSGAYESAKMSDTGYPEKPKVSNNIVSLWQ